MLDAPKEILGAHMSSNLQRTLTRISLALLLLVFVAADGSAGSNPLTERGIDPAILDLMVSDISQNIRYTRYAEIEITTDEGTISDRALIQFDPATDYGIDLYMKFAGGPPQTAAARKFRRVLENNMRLQHRIRRMDFQVDPKSLTVESQNGSKAVILFRYSKFALPQQVAWMRFLHGRIWVDGDRVERIRVESDEGRSFRLNGQRVTEFTSEARFVRLANGLDVVAENENKSVGRNSVVTTRTWSVAFAEPDGDDLTPDTLEIPAGIDLSEFDTTVRVKLDRKWPIFGKGARKLGFEVPKPFGISLMYTDLSTNFDFTSFEINGESAPIEALFSPAGSGIDLGVTYPQVRLDWFPFPFLNLMALAGEVEADGNLFIRTTDLGQLIGLPPVIEETIKVDTATLGVGATAAMGYKNFFGSITATYFVSVTEDANTESTTATLTPQVGYYIPNWRLRILVGVEYLDIENTMEGSIDLGNGQSLDFNIGVETAEWAGRIGLYKEIGNHMELTLSYTYGEDRSGLSTMLGYRF